jgi:phage tail-like protein
MSFSNQQYVYDHLPARYRQADKDLFLKRFLQMFGETLDEWDGKFDAFFENIDSDTADGEWISFWLEALFGWSWFPGWFTLANKRTLYSHFAQHLARRGTRRGIELWLLDFGIVARVHTRTPPWGEFVWGETAFAIAEPLHLIIEILFLQSPAADMCFFGEGAWGESYYVEPAAMFTDKEILDLVRYVQPHAQEITIVWRTGRRSTMLPGGEWPLYGEPLYGE